MTFTRPRDERGSASVFIVGMAITLVILFGLVVDGGGALNARMTLADDVEAAAVAGAQATDIDRLRDPDDGALVIDRDLAATRAREVLAGRGYENIRVSFSGDLTSVTVSADDTVPTQTLLLVGKNDFEISATATAEAETLP